MTTTAVGAYWLLLCKAWFEDPPGTIPDDDGILSRWARLTVEQWGEVKNQVLAAFNKKADGRWHQKRMKDEFAKFRLKVEQKSESGKAGANAKWKRLTNSQGKIKRSERLAEARKKGTHSERQWVLLKRLLEGTCVICFKKEPDVKIVKDHVIPIYQDGSDSIENIQPACRSCNAHKGPDNRDLRPLALVRIGKAKDVLEALQLLKSFYKTHSEAPAERLRTPGIPDAEADTEADAYKKNQLLLTRAGAGELLSIWSPEISWIRDFLIGQKILEIPHADIPEGKSLFDPGYWSDAQIACDGKLTPELMRREFANIATKFRDRTVNKPLPGGWRRFIKDWMIRTLNSERRYPQSGGRERPTGGPRKIGTSREDYAKDIENADVVDYGEKPGE